MGALGEGEGRKEEMRIDIEFLAAEIQATKDAIRFREHRIEGFKRRIEILERIKKAVEEGTKISVLEGKALQAQLLKPAPPEVEIDDPEDP